MRLLNVHTKKLHTFYDAAIPDYAILSHTWLKETEEVSFAWIRKLDLCHNLKGFRKIEFLCQQAAKDGYEYAWIDTCCIDKTSSAELLEAINSMFAWYRNAKICYAYLADVGPNAGIDDLLESRWWTRVWTLQEFLAPRHVVFYSKDWTVLESKFRHASYLSAKIGIDAAVLKDPDQMFSRSIAQRMSWAAMRQATRLEDVAYALLGIFGINMPLLYGEGSRAFLRLQQKILRTNSDRTLFAWRFSPKKLGELTLDDFERASPFGVLASSPDEFKSSGDIVSHHLCTSASEVRDFNGVVHLGIPLLPGGSDKSPYGNIDFSIGLLPCGLRAQPQYVIGILLQQLSESNKFARNGFKPEIFTFLVDIRSAIRSEWKDIAIGDYTYAIQNYSMSGHLRSNLRYSIMVDMSGVTCGYEFHTVFPRAWTWDSIDNTLRLDDPSYDALDQSRLAFYCKETKRLLFVGIGQLRPPAFLTPEWTIDCGLYSGAVSEANVAKFMDNISALPCVPALDPRHEPMAVLRAKRVFNHAVYSLKLAEVCQALDLAMVGTKIARRTPRKGREQFNLDFYIPSWLLTAFA